MRDQLWPANPEKSARVCLPATFSTSCALNWKQKKIFQEQDCSFEIKVLKRNFLLRSSTHEQFIFNFSAYLSSVFDGLPRVFSGFLFIFFKGLVGNSSKPAVSVDKCFSLYFSTLCSLQRDGESAMRMA